MYIVSHFISQHLVLRSSNIYYYLNYILNQNSVWFIVHCLSSIIQVECKNVSYMKAGHVLCHKYYASNSVWHIAGAQYLLMKWNFMMTQCFFQRLFFTIIIFYLLSIYWNIGLYLSGKNQYMVVFFSYL